MTEPVEGISRAREVAEKIRRDKNRPGNEKHAEHHEVNEDDNIDISREARDRAAGRKP